MKAVLLFVSGLCFALSTCGQGLVDFSNGPFTGANLVTRLTTNSCPSPPPGQSPNVTGRTLNGYTIGLYIAPFDYTDEGYFQLIATTFSFGAFAPGFFNAGTITNSHLPVGVPVAFQIRAWETRGGPTYEGARYSCCYYTGKSFTGFVVPASPGENAPTLMGTGYGQVPGFSLSSFGLGDLGCPVPVPVSNVTMRVLRSTNGAHTVSWTNTATSHLLEWAPYVPASNQWQPVITGVSNNTTNATLSYTSTNSDTRFYRLRRL